MQLQFFIFILSPFIFCYLPISKIAHRDYKIYPFATNARNSPKAHARSGIFAPSDFAFFLSFLTKKAGNNFGIKAIDFSTAFGYNLYKRKISANSVTRRCLN